MEASGKERFTAPSCKLKSPGKCPNGIFSSKGPPSQSKAVKRVKAKNVEPMHLLYLKQALAKLKIYFCNMKISKTFN
jgi:hypothetical protein